MAQPRGDLDFTQKTICANGAGQLRPKNLYRDVSVVLQIPGQIDRRHPSAAELTLERVAIRERGAQGGIDILNHVL